LHSEAFAGVVFPPHRVRARARQILTRKRGLDVHWASIASRLLSTIPPDAERRLSEHKFAGITAASESFLPLVACRTTTFFFAAAGRGLTYAPDVIAARKFIPILRCEARGGPRKARKKAMQDGGNLVVMSGLLIGVAYGAIGLLSGFCLLSGLRGWWGEGDGRLIRTYALALGVAIAATQLLAAGNFVDLGKSIYLQPSFSAPLMFVGGLLFGYGMVLSNGCGSRALVLLGRGNLRSLVVVLVLGIAAQMTLKGLIAPARIAVLQASQSAPQTISLPALFSTLGLGATFARTIAASVVAGALIIFAFAHAPFQRAWEQVGAGIGVGLLIAAGWFATGYLAADDFNPVAVTSLTFIAPIADAVQYAMLSTGLTLNFGITMVAGVFAGSLVTALATRRFRLESFTSPRQMVRSIAGAALMGAGGAMAYGCSIGQGLTGLSTLALPSFVAVAGILLGTAAGLRGVLRVQPLVPAPDATQAR
jgi:uncharacterized membrane protein YedE/YeeE